MAEFLILTFITVLLIAGSGFFLGYMMGRTITLRHLQEADEHAKEYIQEVMYRTENDNE